MSVSATTFHRSQQVDEGDLLPEESVCPLCGGVDRKRVARLQALPVVWLLRCATCLGSSAHRMPTTARLGRYYETYYAGKPAAPHVTLSDAGRAARHIAPLVGAAAGAHTTSLLDFGGGDGSLAWHLGQLLLGNCASERVEITVIDQASGVSHPDSPALTMRVANSLGELTSGPRYDIILASAVLEHLPGPISVLAQLLDLLRPGGRLYVRTPWVAPLMVALGFVGIEIDFTYPGHLYDLGGDFWERAVRLPLIPRHLAVTLEHSAPSFVETSFAQAPVRTLAAMALKAPAKVLGASWPWVGGWEAVLERAR